MTLRLTTRVILWIICSLLALMWVYAFLFASRESVNKIGDAAWQARSQATCLVAENVRFALEDLTKMDPNDSRSLSKKADIVDQATDALENAINTIAKDVPQDAKGQAIVPAWISEYRMYLKDRRLFSQALRTATSRPYFAESEVEGVPVSARLGKFARENDMKACQPPYDLSV